MNQSEVPIYVFESHAEAKAAIESLNAGGVDVKQLSLVGKGYHTEEHPIGFYSVGDKIRSWGAFGALWGGVWGLLLAPAVFFLPGFGLLAMAGPLTTALVGALEGAAVGGGLSALGVALVNIGYPKAQVIKYETALKADKYLLMIHGGVADADNARRLLMNSPGAVIA